MNNTFDLEKETEFWYDFLWHLIKERYTSRGCKEFAKGVAREIQYRYFSKQREWPCEHIVFVDFKWGGGDWAMDHIVISDVINFCSICGAKRPEKKVKKSLAEKISEALSGKEHHGRIYAELAAEVAEEHFKQCCDK